MLFQRFISEGLAHFSYIIGSGGQAAVIDPRRDTGIYLDSAAENGMKITGIFETHRNEDYATGSAELADTCRAPVYHGAALPFLYGMPVRDGDRFPFGSLLLTIRETPGHTPESISIVVTRTARRDLPYLVFTGDLLFAGDTGRVDLGDPLKRGEWAGTMYDSIVTRILPLGDGTILCPAHGAGSVCGGDIQDYPLTTIGYERAANPALALDRARFIAGKIAEHHYYPPYFSVMEQSNLGGWPKQPALTNPEPVSPAGVRNLFTEGVQVVDIRSPAAFAGGHIPGSLSLWREGIPAFAGWFLDYRTPVLIVDDFNTALVSVQRDLRRLGFDNPIYSLDGGFIGWVKQDCPVARCGACPVREAVRLISTGSPFILDVRDIRNRRENGYIAGSHHVWAGDLPHHLAEIPKDHDILVYCDAGYKSSMSASILLRNGYTRVTNILGGFTAWKNAGFAVEPDRNKT